MAESDQQVVTDGLFRVMDPSEVPPPTGSPEPGFWAEPKPGVPHIYIGARPGEEQANQIILQPVEHKPEFETSIKLVPVEHTPEFIDDTGRNAQEPPETLAHQQRDLVEGRRSVQMFPAGTTGLPVPAGHHETRNDRGTFHYDPSKISEQEIHDLSAQGRENEFLGLGPVSKAEVEERVARGETPVAITEYTPDGTEVRSAAGTEQTAGSQKQFFEQTKRPENIVTVGPPPKRIPPSFGYQPTPEQNAVAHRVVQALAHAFLGAPMRDVAGNQLPPSYGLPGQVYEAIRTPGDIAMAPPTPQMPETGTWTDEQEAQRQIDQQATQQAGIAFGANTAMQAAGIATPFAQRGAAGIFGGKLAKGVREGGPLKENFDHARALDDIYGDPDKLLELSQETGKTISELIAELRQNIWDQTGFFKDIDGQWRHEIPDQGASLRKTNSGSPYPIDVPHRTTFGDVVVHPWLFEQYPELAKLPLEFERDTGQHYRAYFDPRKGGSIGIVARRPTEANVANVLNEILHEASHAVAGREGTQAGANPLDPKMKKLAKFALKQKGPAAEARMSEIHEDIREWHRNNPDREPVDFFDAFPETAKEYSRLLDITKGDKKALWREQVDLYERSAGEVEARNVQARAKMDEPTRKMAHPDDTQEYPYERQIYTPKGSSKPALKLKEQPETTTEAPFPQLGERYPEVGPPEWKTEKKKKYSGKGPTPEEGFLERYKQTELSKQYPDVELPEGMKRGKRTGLKYLGKGESEEAAALTKFRSLVQEDINAGRYEPYFDVNKRFDVNPKNYPREERTTEAAIPAKKETIERYEKIANNPEAIKRLVRAYNVGRLHPLAKGWYMMGQLEKEFVNELGPVEGRKQFERRFGLSMAATTGGSAPQANLILSQYANYLREKGLPYPKESYEVPYPVGGGKYGVMPNIAQHERLMDIGTVEAADNPKRFNFRSNFAGHADRATIDEQMSKIFDPKMSVPPGDSYGVFEAALIKTAKKLGVSPRELQEVAWAGHKAMTDPSYSPHPMIQTINEAIERTHRITGMPKQEIVRRGLVRGEIPIYGLGAGVIGAAAATGEAQDTSQ